MDDLNKLRNEIDSIDKSLVELFEKRMEMVNSIAQYKKENNIPVLNLSREEQVLEKISDHLKNKDLEEDLRKLFIYLMDLSKDYQKEEINIKDV